MRRRGRAVVRTVLVTALLGAATACGDNGPGTSGVPSPEPAEGPEAIVVSSSAFTDGATIPRRFTCDGDDVSPPLELTDVPAEAAELALLVEDPDAPDGTFVHWVVWGIDPGQATVGAGEVPGGATQGANDFGDQSYGGPCPPSGKPHRYVFTVLALSSPLKLAQDATADDVRGAAEGKTLAWGDLSGLYGR